MRDRTRARELAAEFHRKGDPTGWFDVLYREAEEGKSTIPWDDRHPTPHLVGFWMKHAFTALGLEELLFDILPDVEEPDVRRFRVLFQKPQSASQPQ